MKKIVISFIIMISITLMSVYGFNFNGISVHEKNSHSITFVAFNAKLRMGDDDLPMPQFVYGEEDIPGPF